MFNKYDFKISDVCHCECHKQGLTCLCFVPCCDLCGEKHLNKDGKLQVNKYIRLKEDSKISQFKADKQL